jgi:hypothetical protein
MEYSSLEANTLSQGQFVGGVDGLFGHRDSRSRERCDLVGHLQRSLHQLFTQVLKNRVLSTVIHNNPFRCGTHVLVRHHSANQAVTLRLLSRDHVARQHHLHRLGLADSAD